jgi:hypothetical protein
MKYSYQYNNDDEKIQIIAENEDKHLIEEQKLINGNFLVFADNQLQPPEPGPADRIATLENEAALLALELVNTQTRLDQSEADAAAALLELVDTQTRLQQSEGDHAALLLELVDKGVI